MREILFFSMEKKIKNQGSDTCADAVGEEVEPVAGAGLYNVFLYQFGQAAVCDADDDGKDKGFSPLGWSIGDKLLTVAPEAGKGKAGVHKNMDHLVESNNGLDAGK